MAKRKSAQDRQQQRQQFQRRQRWLTGLVGASIFAIVVVILLLSAAPAPTAEEQARYDLDPALGSPDAPVTVIEYGAYGCPSCRLVHQQGFIERLLEDFPGQIRVVFRDLPVISPRYDNAMAQFAQCALDQGNGFFWAIHDIFYTQFSPTDGIPSTDTLVSAAQQVGLDADIVRACYEAGTHRNTVSYDQRRAEQLGLNATPTFLVNGQRVFLSGYEDLRMAVEQALASS